jgi:CxxC motif-containing protein (DUF1111 family)
MGSSRFSRRRRDLKLSPRVVIRTTVAVALLAAGYTGVHAWWNRVTPEQIELGRTLFEHKWTKDDPLAGHGDGLGPVFNARSCVECHHQGGTGGGGSPRFNVEAFAILPSPDRPHVEHGVVHAFALEKSDRETSSVLSVLFPSPPPREATTRNCRYIPPTPDPVQINSINTPALFGSGQIDSLSSWAIKSNAMERSFGTMQQELSGDFKGVPAGRVRILADGRVGKFGWKAQFATLEEFVGAACAMELGLSNPIKAQQVPRKHRDDDDAPHDLTRSQLTAMVRFTAQLPAPVRDVPASMAAACAEGEALFSEIGCARCHTPDLGGVKGIYSDLCLYNIEDQENPRYGEPLTPLPAHEPRLAEWKTPPLWGVADSAPYMHDGSAATLEGAIESHHGAAERVRKRYHDLPSDKQKAVLAFLGSLRAPR